MICRSRVCARDASAAEIKIPLCCLARLALIFLSTSFEALESQLLLRSPLNQFSPATGKNLQIAETKRNVSTSLVLRLSGFRCLISERLCLFFQNRCRRDLV